MRTLYFCLIKHGKLCLNMSSRISSFQFFKFTALCWPKCRYWFTAGLLYNDFVCYILLRCVRAEIATTIYFFLQQRQGRGIHSSESYWPPGPGAVAHCSYVAQAHFSLTLRCLSESRRQVVQYRHTTSQHRLCSSCVKERAGVVARAFFY